MSLPRTQPVKRISQGTFSRERSQLLYPRVTTVTLLFINSTPSEVSAIPCVLFGNPLRALFLKNRDFFCQGEIFLPNTRGPLGCLLGFWPSGPKACGGNYSYENSRNYTFNTVTTRLRANSPTSWSTRLSWRVNLLTKPSSLN